MRSRLTHRGLVAKLLLRIALNEPMLGPIKLHALFHSSFPARVHKSFAWELSKSDTLNLDWLPSSDSSEHYRPKYTNADSSVLIKRILFLRTSLSAKPEAVLCNMMISGRAVSAEALKGRSSCRGHRSRDRG